MTTEHISPRSLRRLNFKRSVFDDDNLFSHSFPLSSFSRCRFLHPLSPRGKLVHLGLEGLASTNALLDQAMQHEEGVVLRNEIFRVALDANQASTLQKTARILPNLSQWMEPSELDHFHQQDLLGALRLHSRCKVIHVPSYLKGLWSACCASAPGRSHWIVDPGCTAASYDWKQKLADFDTVVFSAGSGLFSNLVPVEELPVSLVRGQSVVLKLDGVSLDHAILGGKYVSPLPEKDEVLIGATHEFDKIPWDKERVQEELKERSYQFTSTLWDNGCIDRITSGVRVQSDRGKLGRMPIIGKYETQNHDNAWIFTGLSSRGLLYHGVFGDLLTDMLVTPTVGKEELALDWWNKK
jgi:glycine/D-amino acid oxidase-like deaminating enzyme